MQPTDLNPILHLDQSPILPTRTQPGSNIPHSPPQTRPEEGIKIRAVTKDQYPPGDDIHQTLLAGWAYKHAYQNNDERRQTLTGFIDTYNQTRPHSELGGQSPITVLVNHLCGKDT